MDPQLESLYQQLERQREELLRAIRPIGHSATYSQYQWQMVSKRNSCSSYNQRANVPLLFEEEVERNTPGG